jgi:hypothetical protein
MADTPMPLHGASGVIFLLAKPERNTAFPALIMASATPATPVPGGST